MPSEVEYVSLPLALVARHERRLEGEAYLSTGYGVQRRISGSLSSLPMADMANIWQPSRLKGTLVSPKHGLPFLTATQVFDIRPTPRKFLARNRTPDIDTRFVERGWIFVTRSGSVGDTIISYSPHHGAVISDDLLRVVPKRESERGYLYTFLRTRFGRAIMRSTRYGSIVKHLEPEHLFELPVPTPSAQQRTRLGRQITRVFGLREEAFGLTREAEELFANRFEGTVLDSTEAGFSVSASGLFSGRRRMDGYHYNPGAQALLAALQKNGSSVVPLSSVTESAYGVPRFKHVYQGEGIPYLDSEDLFKVNPELHKFIPKVAKADAAKYYVERGWLLMASSGQIYGLNGSVILAGPWHEGKIVSNHVLRIVPSGIRPGYLAMALSHPVFGRPLVLRLAFGSEVPEITPEELLGFPVVRLPKPVEDKIADRVERASSLREEADRQEDAAVQYLETDLERRLEDASRPASVRSTGSA